MLKRLSALLIALSIFFTLNSFAHASTTLKTSQIVSNVVYDKYDGKLYAYTAKAADGSFWVLDVELSKGETLAQLQKRLIGHKIDIYYELVDGEEEIVKTVIQ
jgi:hypothetical protein